MTMWLDTNVFWNKQFLLEIKTFSDEVAISSIVFYERLRQLLKHSITAADFRQYLENNKIYIRDFTSAEGNSIPQPIITDDKLWKSLARDAMIASHIGPNDIIVTSNSKDFIALEIPFKQILQV